MTQVTEDLARRIEAIADGVLGIRPISRVSPHVFLEDKHALHKRLVGIAADVRNASGGAAPQPIRPGRIAVGHRMIRVEVRRRRAA